MMNAELTQIAKEREQYRQEVDALKAENARLREQTEKADALAEYSDHKRSCPVRIQRRGVGAAVVVLCTCGFEEALSDYRSKP